MSYTNVGYVCIIRTFWSFNQVVFGTHAPLFCVIRPHWKWNPSLQHKNLSSCLKGWTVTIYYFCIEYNAFFHYSFGITSAIYQINSRQLLFAHVTHVTTFVTSTATRFSLIKSTLTEVTFSFIYFFLLIFYHRILLVLATMSSIYRLTNCTTGHHLRPCGSPFLSPSLFNPKESAMVNQSDLSNGNKNKTVDLFVYIHAQNKKQNVSAIV